MAQDIQANPSEEGSSQNTRILPDFCKNQTILSAMLIGELLALTLTIARPWAESGFSYFGYSSLFIQWIILANIGILCWGRDWLARYSPVTILALVFCSFQVVTLLITELGFQVVHRVVTDLQLDAHYHLRLLISNALISAIISVLLLFFYHIQYQNMQRGSAATMAKIEALQARIRPHFLFNSMNTIANLVHVDPNKAEDAILDLSELFRSSLGKHEFVSIDEEIRITKRYINIESLRLGDRLSVYWDIPEDLPELDLPALILQPLVENAIYHGVEPLPNGGAIEVSFKTGDNALHINISNPVPNYVPEARRKGNQVAMNNIRQRLALTYEGAAKMQTTKTNETHTVSLTFPIG